MARWIRGFLSFGILAAPHDNYTELAGDRESYKNGFHWAAVCTSCPTPRVVELGTYSTTMNCFQPGHETYHVKLVPCAGKGCDMVLVYTEVSEEKRTCKNGHHTPRPDLQGKPDDTAAGYRPPPA